MTIHMLLAGTSGLGDAAWGHTGRTIAQSLAFCQAQPLTAPPGAKLQYQNCTTVVLGTIVQKVTGKPWEAGMRELVLGPAGMTHSGRVTDALVPPARAEDYSGSTAAPQGNAYNDFFQLYSTAHDVYAYDTALFAGRLLSKLSLDRLFAPRAPVVPPDAGIENARVGYTWKIGTVFGHRVIYTTDTTNSFTAANVQLPDESDTIVVISNDDRNHVESIAVQLARMMLPKKVIARASGPGAVVATILVPDVFGTPSGDGRALWVGGNHGQVTRIDPRTNTVAARIRINDPATRPDLVEPGIIEVASASGQVWATDRLRKAVVEIDPATNRVVARVPLPIVPWSMDIAGRTLWVDDSYEDEPGVNTIVRVDLRTRKVVATVSNAQTDLGEPYLTLASSPSAVWYADWQTDSLKRLDSASNKVVASIHAGLQPASVAVGDGAVWTLDHYSNQVTRIDPATNRVVAVIPLNGYPSSADVGDCCHGDIAVGAGGVWTVAGSANRMLVRIDPRSNRVTGSLAFSEAIGPIVVADGSVWVEVEGVQLYRIDPKALIR